MVIPVLETERILLRPLTVEDAEAVYVWTGDKRVNKYMPYPLYTDIEDVKKWLSGIYENNENYLWGFVFKENNLLIGSGDIEFSEEKKSWDFGYNIRYDYWNKGIATEVTKCMIEFTYDKLGARDFSANCAVDNVASGNVMEKCGLQFERFGQYSKFDNSETFKARYYRMHLD